MTEKRKRGRPPKHGVYSTQALRPMVDKKLKLISDILAGDRPNAMIGKTDRIAVELLARTLARIELIDDWCFEHDMLAPESVNIMKIYLSAMNTALRICHELGLTSKSRFHLGLEVAKTKDMATQLLEARQEDEALQLTQGKETEQ